MVSERAPWPPRVVEDTQVPVDRFRDDFHSPRRLPIGVIGSARAIHRPKPGRTLVVA